MHLSKDTISKQVMFTYQITLVYFDNKVRKFWSIPANKVYGN